MNFTKTILETTESTNLFISQLYQKDQSLGNQLILADYQSGGRGLDQNSWTSEKGMNLLFSLGFKPIGLLPEKQFLLSKMISICLVKVLSKTIDPHRIKIKWPNDIYIDQKKVAGILITSSLFINEIDYTIIGIGLNVNQLEFSSQLPNAISMKLISGIEYDRYQLLDEFLQVFASVWDQSKETIGIKKLESEYLKLLYHKDEWASYKLNGKLVEAFILGVNTYGQLEIQLRDASLVTCDLKEIVFL